ncbi:UNKNOWN [Stylonychia lemnae]|uniref:Chromo domain-containing protein n=1 Tax=Stylonychia lemnae TaxID=5949 RepID=A0A078AGK3_STYLE|nr:UNKNOWN [Stylonychia lemnae]|eukprot:CDW81405.1 UNKNOWN [Stylonychia lemnae]
MNTRLRSQTKKKPNPAQTKKKKQKNDPDDQLYEIESLHGHRTNPKSGQIEYLTKWYRYSAKHNSWLQAENFEGPEARRILMQYIDNSMPKEYADEMYLRECGTRSKITKHLRKQYKTPPDANIPVHMVPDQESLKINEQEEGKADMELSEGTIEVLTKLIEYGEAAEDYSEWDKERMNQEYRDEGEPDWSTMVCESFEEFESERYEEIVE